METATMGKVLVAAKIENLYDLNEVRLGQRKPEDVRRVEVTDALVDTGATELSMTKSLVTQLGLVPFKQRNVRTANGNVVVHSYTIVRLTVQGRECHCEVTELPGDVPVLIGQVPLELMDWVVDPKRQRLIHRRRCGTTGASTVHKDPSTTTANLSSRVIERGDIRWFRFASPDKRRPVWVVALPEALPSLAQVTVFETCDARCESTGS